jgi:hypothetical protein
MYLYEWHAYNRPLIPRTNLHLISEYLIIEHALNEFIKTALHEESKPLRQITGHNTLPPSKTRLSNL